MASADKVLPDASRVRRSRGDSSSGNRQPDVSVKRIRDEFFKPHQEAKDVWVCKCGTSRKQTGGGYTNLVSHVRAVHPEALEEMRNDGHASTVTQTSSIYTHKKTVHLFGWIDLVVNALQPFSIVENPVYRRHVRYEPISTKTLTKYLQLLIEKVEERIKKLLPSKFALVFDGWTTSDTHYMAIFASFPFNNTKGFKTVILAFSPFEDEVSHDRQHHLTFAEFVTDLYGKSL